MAATLSPEFEQAVKDCNLFGETPPNGDMLEIYALFKQAKQDPTFENSPVPGMFALKDKAKRKAWEEKKHLTSEEAQAAYIKKVEELKANPQYKWSADNQAAKIGQ